MSLVRATAVESVAVGAQTVTITFAPGLLAMAAASPGPGIQSGAPASVNDLAAAGKVMDRGGLTRAGRALEKHGGRQGSVFPKATGNVGDKNRQGQEILERILTDPGTKSVPNNYGGQDYLDPSGRGARFDRDGSFRGFSEPPS